MTGNVPNKPNDAMIKDAKALFAKITETVPL